MDWLKYGFVLGPGPSPACPVNPWLDFLSLSCPISSQIQNSIRCLWATSQDGTPHRGTDWTSRWLWPWTEPSTLLLGEWPFPHVCLKSVWRAQIWTYLWCTILKTMTFPNNALLSLKRLLLLVNHAFKIFCVCLTTGGFRWKCLHTQKLRLK